MFSSCHLVFTAANTRRSCSLNLVQVESVQLVVVWEALHHIEEALPILVHLICLLVGRQLVQVRQQLV